MSHEAVATDVLLSGGGVWVVTGAQGVYSDRVWWIEAVAVSGEAAQAMVDACAAWVVREKAYRETDEYWERGDGKTHAPSPSRHFPDSWEPFADPEWTAEHLPSLGGIPGVLIPGGAE